MNKGRKDALGQGVTAIPAFAALRAMPKGVDDNGMKLHAVKSL